MQGKGTNGAGAPAEKKKKKVPEVIEENEVEENDDEKNPSHATAAFLANEEERANSNGQVEEISGDMYVHNEQVRVYQMYVLYVLC